MCGWTEKEGGSRYYTLGIEQRSSFVFNILPFNVSVLLGQSSEMNEELFTGFMKEYPDEDDSAEISKECEYKQHQYFL